MSKYRTSFVTNSSSSSFIIGFASDDELENFKNTFPVWLAENIIEQAVADVKNNQITRERAIEAFQDELYNLDWTFHGKRYWDLTKEEKQSDEYKQYIQNRKDRKSQEFIKEIDGMKYFAEVSYGDHDQIGSILEHKIMPGLPNTIRRFSHH